MFRYIQIVYVNMSDHVCCTSRISTLDFPITQSPFLQDAFFSLDSNDYIWALKKKKKQFVFIIKNLHNAKSTE